MSNEVAVAPMEEPVATAVCTTSTTPSSPTPVGELPVGGSSVEPCEEFEESEDEELAFALRLSLDINFDDPRRRELPAAAQVDDLRRRELPDEAVAVPLTVTATEVLPSGLATSVSGFASVPEGALLRIAAQVDIHTGIALCMVSRDAGEPTTAALGALREAFDQAQAEHRAATQAVEDERAQSTRPTGEQGAMAAALAALAPLRALQTQNRFPQLADVFQQLEEGSTGTLSAEVEAALTARLAAAAALLEAREAAARAHVADGELRAAVFGSQGGAVGITV